MSDDGTVGGSHQCLFDIARTLPRYGIEPVVLFFLENRFADALRAEGVETLIEAPLPEPAGAFYGVRRSIQLAWSVARCATLVRRLRIDLVHLNNSLGAAYEWLLAAKLVGIPCITHQRMDYSPVGHRLWSIIIRGYDRVIAISDHVAEGARRAGIAPSRVTRIYDGIDAERLASQVRRSAAEVRQEFGLTPGRVLIVMVAHLREWKGQDVVLRALASVEPDARRNLFIAFAGGAGTQNRHFLERLEQLVVEHSLGANVRFLGERQDAPDLTAAADVVLHASTRPEPFGLSVVEGLAFGKTVIASSLGGPAEVLANGPGFLFDPGVPGALTSLLSRAANRRLMIDADDARERAARFSVERNVGQIVGVYHELLRRA